MPTLSADFEAGTNGSTVLIGDTASQAQFDATQTVASGTLTYSTTQAAHGTKSLSTATGATLGASSVVWTTSLTGSAAAGPFYAQANCFFPSFTKQPVPISFMSGTSTNRVGIRITLSGTIAVLVAGVSTVDHTLTSVIPANTWVRIELIATGAASGGSYTINYYATVDATSPTETFTNASVGTGGTIDRVAFGITQQLASVPTFFMDDVYASSAGLRGPVPLSTGATVSPSVSRTAAGSTGLSTGAAVAPSVAVTATGAVTFTGTSTASPVATVAATGAVAFTGTSTRTATVTISAAGVAGLAGAATPTVTVGITAAGAVVRSTGATPAAVVTVSTAGATGVSTGATGAPVVTITAAGVAGASTGATSSVAVSIAATGALSAATDASVAVAITFTATGFAFTPPPPPPPPPPPVVVGTLRATVTEAGSLPAYVTDSQFTVTVTSSNSE